jgi:hypothetical protein
LTFAKSFAVGAVAVYLFASLDTANFWGPVVSIGTIGAVIVAVVAIIQWRKIRIAEMEATLKQQMLDRGMTADEIAMVLNATPRNELGRR